MLLMLRFGVERLHLNKFVAKIKLNNIPSIKMFAKMGFVEESRSSVFQEVTFAWTVTESAKVWLSDQAGWEVVEYQR